MGVGAYGFDPEFEGLEPLFHGLKNGDQNNNFSRLSTALNPYLESTPIAKGLKVSGYDAEQGEKGLKNNACDKSLGTIKTVCIQLYRSRLSNSFDQNSASIQEK